MKGECLFQVGSAINGPGQVKMAWQKSSGNHLAIVGSNKVVSIVNRRGEQMTDAVIPLQGTCTSLDWDADGDVLAIAQDTNTIILLWIAASREVIKLDTGMNKGGEVITLMLWARSSHMLAVGTNKGNLLLYNHANRRKVSILGKHAKKITCGAWSVDNYIALGSEDKSLSVSNSEGDTVRHTTLRDEPHNIQFSMPHEQSALRTPVTMVLGDKNLFLYDMDDTDSPLELTFQPTYGALMAYAWHARGVMMLGFKNGFLIVISLDKEKIGHELFHSHNHKDYLSAFSICRAINQVATSGDSCVKIHDLSELKDLYSIIDIDEDMGALDQLDWEPSGQLLSISTQKGNVLTYLVKLPMLGAVFGTRVAFLSSLRQITLINNVEEEPPISFDVPVEPSFVSLGPFNFAVGMNDRAWIYELDEDGPPRELTERSYLGNVSEMHFNGSYAAVLIEGKLEMHLIDESLDFKDSYESRDSGPSRDSWSYPTRGQVDCNDSVTCLGLTQDFLVFATGSGVLYYFVMEDWNLMTDYTHLVGIVKLFPNVSATRVVFIDEKSDGYLYNAVSITAIELPSFPPNVCGVLWDNWPLDKHIFVVFDETSVYTYVHFRDSINGTACKLAGVTKLPFGYKPVMLYNGEVSCQTLSGKLQVIKLISHNYQDDQDLTEPELKASLKKSIQLSRLKDAWTFASALDNKSCWAELANAALEHLDIELAIRVFQFLGDVAMVYTLQQIRDIEDRNLFVGYVATCTGSYDLAQELFLMSSNPNAALEMRRDLLQWDQALHLAKTLAPDQLPYISKEYAQQLEFTGDYANALLHYEKGIQNNTSNGETHNLVCREGISRMAIKTGDIRRGITTAQAINTKQLFIECAAILQDMKSYQEAGSLYERAECWDKAASVYIKMKNWSKVGKLMDRVSSSKLRGQYAKAREADGHYQQAALSYESAKEYNNAIRVYLDHLKQPDEAVRIVRETSSTTGAKMVAKFFQDIGDFPSALQFLVLSMCNEEAYAMAEAHNQMELYAEVIGGDASPEDYLRIADHFESKADHFNAGLFFFKAKEYGKALDHLLACPTSLHPQGDNIDMAINVVGECKHEGLNQQLNDYLMGDTDGIPKDAKYLFRLYMAMEQYREAARTATLIAREDQAAGNYRNAHDVLFNMYIELKKQGIRIPAEMAQNLALLHSYVLIKLHVKRGNHLKSARMLIKVANNLSKFPNHVVAILTSAVIECQRSGLKSSCFGFAAMLLRPEYRQKIDPKWKKRIEQIVRKPDKSEIEEPLEPCPFCGHPIPQTQLDCPQCKNNIPYCIATGQHMLKEDWSECPSCHFPALYSEFSSFLEGSEVCPMCSEAVKLSDLKKMHVSDMSAYTSDHQPDQ